MAKACMAEHVWAAELSLISARAHYRYAHGWIVHCSGIGSLWHALDLTAVSALCWLLQHQTILTTVRAVAVGSNRAPQRQESCHRRF